MVEDEDEESPQECLVVWGRGREVVCLEGNEVSRGYSIEFEGGS